MRIRIIFLLAILFLISPVLADSHVIILQGGGSEPPVAYLNETVDMSLVLPWSNTIAWWAPGKDVTTAVPDITITVSGFQHDVYLGPQYKEGMWYKWSGKWENAGYNEAFEIKPGTRPVEKITPKPTPEMVNGTIINSLPNTTHIVLAQSDHEIYQYGSEDISGDGYIWLFGTDRHIYGDPLNQTLNGSVYSYDFSQNVSSNLDAGYYQGYLQFTGKNGWQDIFFNTSSGNLDTPYKAVPAVNLSGDAPTVVKQVFDKLRNNTKYCDDQFVPITLDLEMPGMRFTDYYRENDNVIIRGITPLADGTPISFIIDPDHYALPRDIKTHTVTGTIHGDISDQRTFEVTIPVDWNEMSIGDHNIVGTINTGSIKVQQDQSMPVTAIFINPTQTPIEEKVIVEKYGWHNTGEANATNISYIQNPNGSIVKVTPTTPATTAPTPTPIIIIKYINVTQAPTPNNQSPLPVWIAPLGIIITVLLVKKKR